MSNINQRMLLAAALAACTMGLPAIERHRERFMPDNDPLPPPPPPKLNLGRLPHQSTREIERRKRQMERNAAKRVRKVS